MPIPPPTSPLAWKPWQLSADYLGLRYASEAGYDPHALGSFFKALLAEQRINPAGVPAYMLSHPITEDRIATYETEPRGLRKNNKRGFEPLLIVIQPWLRISTAKS